MAVTGRTGNTGAEVLVLATADNTGMAGPAGQVTVEEAVRAFSAAAEAIRVLEGAVTQVVGRVSVIENSPESIARIDQAQRAISETGERLAHARKVLTAASCAVPSAELEGLRTRMDKAAARLESMHMRAVALRERFESVVRTDMLSRGIGAGRRRPAPAPAVPDADGADLRPDPREAHTASEFVAALRQYREWAGDVPFRRMAHDAGNIVAPSTMCTALNGKILPRLEVALAIVTGCGGTEEDRQRFATAWRTIRLSPSKVTRTPSSPAIRTLRSVSAS